MNAIAAQCKINLERNKAVYQYNVVISYGSLSCYIVDASLYKA